MEKRDNKDISTYKEKADVILEKMYYVLIRAQRKVDDKKYREILKKL